VGDTGKAFYGLTIDFTREIFKAISVMKKHLIVLDTFTTCIVESGKTRVNSTIILSGYILCSATQQEKWSRHQFIDDFATASAT
jgi:hypothetical protein